MRNGMRMAGEKVSSIGSLIDLIPKSSGKIIYIALESTLTLLIVVARNVQRGCGDQRLKPMRLGLMIHSFSNIANSADRFVNAIL